MPIKKWSGIPSTHHQDRIKFKYSATYWETEIQHHCNKYETRRADRFYFLYKVQSP